MNDNISNRLCSVLVTCYQREKYIEQSIMSVYNQTHRPIECIVVDDGSTDDSLKVLKQLELRFADEDDFSLIVFSTENRGACAARNLAFSKAKGEFIQNLDSDDLIHPKKIELQVLALINNQDCDSAWNPLKRFEDHEQEDQIITLNANYEIKDATANPFIPQFFPSAGLHRRRVLEKVGLWTESLKRWQDFEYQVRVMSAVKKYIRYDEPMYFFRQHNNGRINDLFNSKKGINTGFLSMQSMEKYLTEVQSEEETTRKSMRDTYSSLFKTSINDGLKEESIKALNFGLKWSSSTKYSVKIKLLIIMIKYLPGAFVRKILKLGGFL